MKRHLFGMVCAVSFLASAALPASAQGSRDPAEMMARADANGDGNIEWAEVATMRETSFGRLDRNGDGYADSSDRPRVGGAQFDQAMGTVGQADANGDGRISREEMINAPSPAFDAADTNGDRVVTAEEMSAMRASRGQ